MLSHIQKILLVPWISVLILLVLAGGSSFQLSKAWEEAVFDVRGNLYQTLILNNIQWNLRQVDENRETQPEKAHLMWDNAKQQLRLLTKTQEGSKTFSSLEAFMDKDENLQRVHSILQQPFFSVNTERIQGRLKGLQDYTRTVTLGTTLFMLVLAVCLMMVTTSDVSKLFQQLKQSRDLSIGIQEAERQRIAQELHDGVIQELIDLKREYAPEKVDHLVSAIRHICHNLKPQVLQDLGLLCAIEFLADELKEATRMGVSVSIDPEGLSQLPKAYELPLFRVVQELLNNIKRHSQATQAGLTLVYQPTESPFLRLYVYDNGQGFDSKSQNLGMGLPGVAERVHQLEGRITIESRPEKGTQIQILIPVKPTV